MSRSVDIIGTIMREYCCWAGQSAKLNGERGRGAPPFHQVSEVGEVGGEPWRLADRLLSGERRRGQCRHPGSPRRTPGRPGGGQNCLGFSANSVMTKASWDGARIEAIVLFHVH